MADISVADLAKFVNQLEKAENEAYDLWSWLPSSRVAERHHGDYYSEFSPSTEDVMEEASMFLAYLFSYMRSCTGFRKAPVDPTVVFSDGDKLTEKEELRFMHCPCGEDHEDE